MSKSEGLRQNIRALMALRGVGHDWRVEVLTLLESRFPIHQMLRDELAKLIRGDDPSGMKLILSGHKKARDASVGAVVRSEYMVIGSWIEERISGGDTRVNALDTAAKEFASSVERCDEALMYYQRARRWLDSAVQTPIGSGWPRDLLENMYHAREAGSAYVVELNRDAFEAFDIAYRTQLK
jgi:hypothetical protein